MDGLTLRKRRRLRRRTAERHARDVGKFRVSPHTVAQIEIDGVRSCTRRYTIAPGFRSVGNCDIAARS